MLMESYFIFYNLKEKSVKDNYNLDPLINLITNLRIESLRIHIRTLIDFFKLTENNENNKKDNSINDISYNDFFCLDPVINVPSQKNFTRIFDNNINIKIIKRKINLATAHLSYARVDQPKEDREPNKEEIHDVIKEICNNMCNFYNAVDKDLLEEEAKEKINSIIKNFCNNIIKQNNDTNQSDTKEKLFSNLSLDNNSTSTYTI